MTVPAITRINGGLEVVAKPSSTTNNGFYAPKLSTVRRDAITASEGAIIYNTDTLLYQVYQNGAWYALTSSLTAIGEGLVPGSSPVFIPSGTAVAVEVAANEVAGFMFYDTTSNTFKVRTNAAWLTVTVA